MVFEVVRHIRFVCCIVVLYHLFCVYKINALFIYVVELELAGDVSQLWRKHKLFYKLPATFWNSLVHYQKVAFYFVLKDAESNKNTHSRLCMVEDNVEHLKRLFIVVIVILNEVRKWNLELLNRLVRILRVKLNGVTHAHHKLILTIKRTADPVVVLVVLKYFSQERVLLVYYMDEKSHLPKPVGYAVPAPRAKEDVSASH